MFRSRRYRRAGESAGIAGREPAQDGQLKSRLGRISVVIACLAVAVVGMPSVTSAGVDDLSADIDQLNGEPIIVNQKRVLSSAEVTGANITGSARAEKFLTEAQNDLSPMTAYQGSGFTAHNFQVFHFGDVVAVVPQSNRMRVWEGVNAVGEKVHQVAVAAEPIDLEAYGAETTSSKWQFAGDDCYTLLVGTWKRVVCYQFDKRNNHQGNNDPRPRDYYRLTVDVNASALTGSKPNEGFNRAWIEMEPTDDFGGPTYRELHFHRRPKDSLTGDDVGKQTVTYGFSNRFDVKLGAAPVQVGASTGANWGTSVEKSLENVHPVQRPDPFTGGAMWCRYTPEEFTGTQSITARLAFKKTRKGGMKGGFYLLTGQQEGTDRCPTQL